MVRVGGSGSAKWEIRNRAVIVGVCVWRVAAMFEPVCAVQLEIWERMKLPPASAEGRWSLPQRET